MAQQRGVIQYTVPVDTPSQTADKVLLLAAGQVAGSVVLAGNPIAVTLPPYAALAGDYVDDAVITRTKGGVIHGRYFGTERRHSFTTDLVAYQHVMGSDNDYLALKMLNDAMAQKIVAQWWPDYANYPAESMFVMMDKRKPEQRSGTSNRFSFSFDVIEIPNIQMPNTVPSFVSSLLDPAIVHLWRLNNDLIGVGSSPVDLVDASGLGSFSTSVPAAGFTASRLFPTGVSSGLTAVVSPTTFAADWTVELRLNKSTATANKSLFAMYSGAGTLLFCVRIDASGNVNTWANGVTFPQAFGAITANLWYHIAIVCSALTYTIYINGVSVVSYAAASGVGSVASFRLCDTITSLGTQGLEGLIDEVAIYNAAAYTGAFTPRTTPL